MSEPQGLGVLPGLQPQVGDAGVLAVALGGGGHHCGGGGGLGQGGDGQPEGRRREHQVGSVGRQVRVQVRMRVGHALQLQLRLDLAAGQRHGISPEPADRGAQTPSPSPTLPGSSAGEKRQLVSGDPPAVRGLNQGHRDTPNPSPGCFK